MCKLCEACLYFHVLVARVLTLDLILIINNLIARLIIALASLNFSLAGMSNKKFFQQSMIITGGVLRSITTVRLRLVGTQYCHSYITEYYIDLTFVRIDFSISFNVISYKLGHVATILEQCCPLTGQLCIMWPQRGHIVIRSQTIYLCMTIWLLGAT